MAPPMCRGAECVARARAKGWLQSAPLRGYREVDDVHEPNNGESMKLFQVGVEMPRLAVKAKAMTRLAGAVAMLGIVAASTAYAGDVGPWPAGASIRIESPKDGERVEKVAKFVFSMK